jgi:ketosteroid isomerase-like protein
MDKSDFTDWVERYVVAWNSNQSKDIEALFTDDAEYLTEPYAAAWRGPDGIVRGWIEAKDEPGDTEFSFEVIATEGDLGFIRGRTVYKSSSRTYDNLWEVTLGRDGKATRFVEWWMKLPQEAD